MEAVMFYTLAAVSLISAILVVSLRRPIHNVLFMIITMIGLAGLFILLHAEFIAMVQLVVYAGAIMVLFLFVIMLLNLDQLPLDLDQRSSKAWMGIGLAVYLLIFLIPVAMQFTSIATKPPAVPAQSNTELLAEALFTTYLLPFEVASVLLLAAMIGAVILAGKKTPGNVPEIVDKRRTY